MTDLYTPLDVESYQTRMILLHPGDKGSMIRCELQRHALVNPPKYTALSYCWGDEANKRPIMVGDIRVMVTVNLEEALQQLREHRITLLWADALCINQADKQEKSLQVRNMKQVYAKAEATYAWLGPSNHDNALSAMHFLGRVTSDVSLLRDTPHSHSIASTTIPEENTSLSKHNLHANTLSCQHCQIKLSFRSLLDLFSRPYWRRRWVIQEVTTSANLRVVCGSQILNLDDMEDALRRCSRSKFWQPQHRSAYRFLRKILDFRKSYHDDKSLTLCKTILSTQDFLSKDHRDNVFALIGICKDGIELVPTASYHRSVEDAAAEITRELIRRNARFDLILVDQRSRCSLKTQLPTWSPDWFSEHLSEDVCAIADEQPYLNRRYAVRALRGNIDTLHIQGVEVGTVVATTSILGSSLHLSTTPAHVSSGHNHIIQDKSNYYSHQTLAAIMTCLLASGTMLNSPMATNGSAHRHHLLQAIRPHVRSKAQDIDEKEQHQSHTAHLHEWLLCNKEFLVRGQKLQDWMQVSRCWYYLQVPYIMFRLLPFGICVTMVALLLPEAFAASAVAMATGPYNQSPITPMLVIVILSTFSLLSSAISAFILLHKVKTTVRNAVEVCPPPPPTRLVRLNTGALGMACSDVEVGDKICLIAGCKLSATVLREKQVDDQTLHSVVGRSMVCMSREDENRYRAFFPRGTQPTETHRWSSYFVRMMWRVLMRLHCFRVYGVGYEIKAERYNQLIDEYALHDEWKEFVLT